jgi:hypothetical protein
MSGRWTACLREGSDERTGNGHRCGVWGPDYSPSYRVVGTSMMPFGLETVSVVGVLSIRKLACCWILWDSNSLGRDSTPE